MMTNWGYEVEGDLTDMLTKEEFNTMTAGKYSGDSRISPSINAAQAAIRNYCGWHVFPSLDCEFNANSEDVSSLIQLPAKHVTAVESVKIDGRTLSSSAYAWKTNGLIKLRSRVVLKDWNDITINYTAGLTESLMGALKELVMHRVTHALAQSYGVQSETAGGVSVTYSANWTNSARATALPDDNKDVLVPYIVRGVF